MVRCQLNNMRNVSSVPNSSRFKRFMRGSRFVAYWDSYQVRFASPALPGRPELPCLPPSHRHLLISNRPSMPSTNVDTDHLPSISTLSVAPPSLLSPSLPCVFPGECLTQESIAAAYHRENSHFRITDMRLGVSPRPFLQSAVWVMCCRVRGGKQPCSTKNDGPALSD